MRCSASVSDISTFRHAAIAQPNRRNVTTTVRAHPPNPRRCKVSITFQRFCWFSVEKRKCGLEIIDLSRSTALTNLLPNLERLKSTNRQENTMQDRRFRGPVRPHCTTRSRGVSKWEAPKSPRQSAPLSCANCFLAASTPPPLASTPRRVPALCDETLPTSPQHGGRRQRILSFEGPVLFPTHARRRRDADSTDRVAPIAPPCQNQHQHQDKMAKSFLVPCRTLSLPQSCVRPST